ncbi:hypothetical protein [Conexibacter woesei]|uniref:DUF3105 domain-containing protein n=1 Tax=Conexibacter woesei (strain DSM 14684 / CCUG 47730 / CIP 108061 / JCM 11494 / NBRC 100937 / ID131577) TaxID=469383 RepID=D3EZD2_CONWI|nr:hypothetical protein [Conexibacter woesei]ADB51897.1 hypothetical protein Cwoe_3479 [Conexibacter woesei DSM 14684]
MSTDQSGPPRDGSDHRGLRRLGGGLLAVAIGLGAVILLLLFLNSRDEAGIDPAAEDKGPVPGVPFAGAADLLDAQQLKLLAAGDVYLLYATPRPPAALRALQEELSGPPDPALEEAGQAVILQRDRSVGGITALAWRRRLVTQDPADPALEAFASYWLGRGEAG